MPACHRRIPAALVVLLSVLPALTVTTSAHAAGQDQPVQLAATPIGEPTPDFGITLAPGEQQELRIALENKGSAPVAARTYAADAYTVVNGGLGAELRDDTVSGTTTWLDYKPSVLQLSPDGFVERAFRVSVPPATAPGEYVTSVVLENDGPVASAGSDSVDTPLRQAVAVTVRVPGPLRPDLELGAASHEVVTGRSVVSVAVDNPGNARLEPAGQVVVHDSAGAVVSRSAVAMGSLYAFTATTVEVTLEEPLAPGAYTVGVALRDGQASATARGLPLEVVAPPQSQSGTSVGDRVTEVLRPSASGVPLLPAIIALLAGAGAAVVLLRRARRPAARRPAARRSTKRRPATHTSAEAATAAAGSPVETPAAAPAAAHPAAHAAPRRAADFSPAPLRAGTGRRRAPRHSGRHRTRA